MPCGVARSTPICGLIASTTATCAAPLVIVSMDCVGGRYGKKNEACVGQKGVVQEVDRAFEVDRALEPVDRALEVDRTLEPVMVEDVCSTQSARVCVCV